MYAISPLQRSFLACTFALLETDAFAACPNLAGIFFEGDAPTVIQRCAPSADTWVPLLTDILTNGALEFTDPDWTVHPIRFYRIRSP